MNILPTLEFELERTREYWLNHPFFAPDTVVLGIDIGIEGIGICVRIGTKVIYCKTLLVELPEAEALAKRRQFRASRHARKNYRTRMRRLRQLFEKHGLPWVSDEVCGRSDPFKLRHRALHGAAPLASKEALSLCIRSAVSLRGYDYFAMSRDGGEYPWGASALLDDACKWLRSAFLDNEMYTALLGMVDELTNKRGEALSDEERARWGEAVEYAFSQHEQRGIETMLERYVRDKGYDRKARGNTYPRKHVEEHLRRILKRHSDLIEDYEGFVNALFLPNDTKQQKKQSIFHYNRKTPGEAKRHFEKKVKPCPYASALKLPAAPCGSEGDVDIMAWKLVDFLSNHRLDLKRGKGISRETLPAAGIAALVGALRAGVNSWAQLKKDMEAAIAPARLASGGDWNKQQLEHLKDICTPSKRSKRANLSAASARVLFALVTAEGTCLEPSAMEDAKKQIELYRIRAEVDAAEGIFPQVRSLLGSVKMKGGVQRFVTTGLLQRLFEKELKPRLPEGKTLPDYVVVECVKGAPLNHLQKAEQSAKQKKNRERRDRLAAAIGLEKMTRSIAYRLKLFEEQGGRLSKGAQPALCPFTGQELGTDPLAENLELAHLYPDSRGGLYVTENLVLTTRQVNQDMGNRTPREAAEAALPGWKSWEAMRRDTKKFDWGNKKRALFEFEPTYEVRFPDFNNLTRTAQLAAELRNLAAIWLGINADPEAMRQRIGNPSGTYTAAARYSMLGPGYNKDRCATTHHRMDALVMSCIPPGEGINDVRYKGIFYTEKTPDARGKLQRRLVSLEGLPLPDFSAIEKDGADCPVIRKRSDGKHRSLGDSTFWSVDDEGKTSQRTKLVVDKKTTADAILQALIAMNVPEKYLPKAATVQRWIESQVPATQDEKVEYVPLRLRGGAAVKSIRKYGSKGGLSNSPMGWNGTLSSKNTFDQLRKLDTTNDRLELWIGWNSKKARWEYQTRVIPSRQALQGIRRMGLPWRGRRNAPDFLIRLLESKKKFDLKTLVCGSLLPHSVHIVDLRIGDRFHLTFDAAVQAKNQAQTTIEETPFPLETWGEICAVSSDGTIEIKALTRKDRKPRKFVSANKIAELKFLPDATTFAQEHRMTPPV